MSLIKRFLKAIAGSKKAVATIGGILFTVALAPLAKKLGYPLTQDQVVSVLGLIAAYVVGQGWADSGKEAAKVNAATVAALPPPKTIKPTVVK